MAQHIFEELKAYAGFGPDDSERLARLLETVDSEIPDIVRRFYDRVESNEHTRSVVEAHSSREKLSRTLEQWIGDFLAGPHDEAYYERRTRIGRVHLNIGLEPRYVFTAMNILRHGLAPHADPEQARSIHALMDIELAIVNDVYWGHVTEQLTRKERLAAIGELAGSMAHEIRNPLAAMQNAAYYLRTKLSDTGGRVARHLAVVEEKVEECNRLVASMLEFAQARPAIRRPVRIGVLVSAALADVAPPPGVTVTTDIQTGVGVLHGDELQLRGLLRNLLKNAVQAMDGDGTIAIEANAVPDRTLIKISDSGPGVPVELRETLFQPLTTTKTYGLGLGLAYSRRVAEAHGGALRLDSASGEGAVFTLELPTAGT